MVVHCMCCLELSNIDVELQGRVCNGFLKELQTIFHINEILSIKKTFSFNFT